MSKKIRLGRARITDYATYLGVIAAFLIVNSLMGQGLLTRSFTGQLVPICCYIVMAVSLNLTVGILGELSLGHAGFMSVGAFSGVVAAMSLQTVIPSGELSASFTAGFILIIITLVVVLNLVRSRSGRAIMALRDNRIAAESVGINITKYKLMAFVTSAALAGAAGALYGLNFSNLTAAKFNFNTSILILVFVVLGGLGNIWGSIVAATEDYRMLVYAIVLILVMLATNNSRLKGLFYKALGPLRGLSFGLKKGGAAGGEGQI